MMLSGKDKGKKGKITHSFPARRSPRLAKASGGARVGEGGSNGVKVVVEGLNLIKKHLRARKQGQKGQIVSKERAVSVSSVALVCKSCGKQTRLGFKIDGPPSHEATAGRSKNKIRICKKCGSET